MSGRYACQGAGDMSVPIGAWELCMSAHEGRSQNVVVDSVPKGSIGGRNSGQNAFFAIGGSLLEFFTVLPKWFPAKIGVFSSFQFVDL